MRFKRRPAITGAISSWTGRRQKYLWTNQFNGKKLILAAARISSATGLSNMRLMAVRSPIARYALVPANFRGHPGIDEFMT
jgi:hypothetical protein